jgi:2-polyprenyl-6-methoxyphenol hydroxylase-like FAD-dependent oxidoreductase
VLDTLGVAKQLAAAGLRLTDFRIRNRDRTLLAVGFAALPSAHPYLLMLPQEQTERILNERLAALGGIVHRGVTAASVQQDGTGATVILESSLGSAAVKARYVVGGDGMHSIVRTAMDTQFDGDAYEDSFILADVSMDWPLAAREVSLFFSPAGLAVVAPLPDNRFRVVASVDQAPEHPTVAHIQTLLDARGPRKGKTVVRELFWSSRFRIHHRLARSYRSGPLFLMGDAAHVHSPAGGQGMNTGLVDAAVLGQLLTRAIRTGDDSVLDQYEPMRRPAAQKVLGMVGWLTHIATLRGSLKLAVRDAALSVMNLLPPVRKKLMMNLSGLSRKALAQLPGKDRAGTPYDLRLQTAKGDRI